MRRNELARSSRYLLPSSANPSGMRPSERFNGEISQRKPSSRMSCNRTVDHASLSPTSFQVDGVRKISTGGSNTARSSMTSTSAFCHWIRRFRLVQATFTDQPWHHLEQCYRAGIIAGSLLGTPCETFSEARFTPAPAECQRRWPRPLRSAEHLFGLPGLSIRELLQTQLGTGFALQGLEVLCHHLVRGGLVVSEHPAAPADLDRPTLWRAGLTELLVSDILMSGRKRFVSMSGVLLQ